MDLKKKNMFSFLFFSRQPQVGADGFPTSKLSGDSLTACEKIGSTATTIEEAKADPKVRIRVFCVHFRVAQRCAGIRVADTTLPILESQTWGGY